MFVVREGVCVWCGMVCVVREGVYDYSSVRIVKVSMFVVRARECAGCHGVGMCGVCVCGYGWEGEGSCRTKLNIVLRVIGMYILLLVCTGDLSYFCTSYLCQNQAPFLLRAPHVEFCYPLRSETHALLERNIHS